MNLSTVHLQEITHLRGWLGDQPRNVAQTHAIGEADAEIIRLDGGGYFAATTDAVAEEIAIGLYRDPFTMGWIAAVNALSDLAAVGVEPIGVLWAAIWDNTWAAASRAEVANGVAAALRSHNTALLGGDTGSAACTTLVATAFGIADTAPTLRSGAQPGDVVCVTGRVGTGAALATRYLTGGDDEEFPERWFRPRARLEEGRRLRGVATSCTDASDGILQAVEVLAQYSGTGATLRWTPELLDKRAAAYLSAKDLPLSLAWIMEIADFELVATVPAHLLATVPGLTPIGRMVSEPGISIECNRAVTTLDSSVMPSLVLADHERRPAVFTDLVAAMRAGGLP